MDGVHFTGEIHRRDEIQSVGCQTYNPLVKSDWSQVVTSAKPRLSLVSFSGQSHMNVSAERPDDFVTSELLFRLRLSRCNGIPENNRMTDDRQDATDYRQDR